MADTTEEQRPERRRPAPPSILRSSGSRAQPQSLTHRGLDANVGADRVKGVVDATIAGAIVTAIGFFDDWTVGPIVIALAAELPAALTFAITAPAYSFVQYWAGVWLIRHWDEWVQGESGRRFEARLQVRRQGRFTRRAVAGVTNGSTWSYVLASIMLAAGDVVAIWKLATEAPIPRRRIVLSAVVYGTWCAALWTATGYGIGVGIRSL